MFIAAVMHHFAFSFKPYTTTTATSICKSLKDAIGVVDIATETVELFVPREVHAHLPVAVRKKFKGARYLSRTEQLRDETRREEEEALLATVDDHNEQDTSLHELDVITAHQDPMDGQIIISFDIGAGDQTDEISPEKSEVLQKKLS